MWLKINSHRARHRAQAKGIKYLELVNWPSTEHYYLTADANKDIALSIKGITILKNRPKGNFTRCWKQM
jgi:hypothetical protein